MLRTYTVRAAWGSRCSFASFQRFKPPPLNSLGLNRIKRAVEIAEKYKVNIALENLRNLDYLDYVMQNISSQRLGFC
jgi:hypothetical protein